MTDLSTLVSRTQTYVDNENQVRFGGKERLKVEQPKKEWFTWENRLFIEWHNRIPNHFCVFIDTFDDAHNAAYVYVWEEEDSWKCTLVTSFKDGPHDPQELPALSKSLDDNELARQLVESVIDATNQSRK